MDKKIIAVDLDSTLYCFLSAFRREAAGLGRDLPPPSAITEWSGIEPYFIDFREFVGCVERTYSMENVHLNQPYEGAVSGLQRLIDAGFDIHYFTDRPQIAAEATLHWLQTHDFPSIENLNVCRDKRKELTELKDNLVTLVDDRPRTLIWALTELGLSDVFSMKHSYNCNLTDIPGVHLFESWPAMADAILEALPVAS